jgi:hypothetical protein
MNAADNSDPRDYILELSSAAATPPPLETSTKPSAAASTFLSIHFRCCNVYSRIYKNAAGTAYAGHCPKCRRRAQIGISADGSNARMFEAF